MKNSFNKDSHLKYQWVFMFLCYSSCNWMLIKKKDKHQTEQNTNLFASSLTVTRVVLQCGDHTAN